MNEQDPIAKAYAHMDEVNAAHARGEETGAERALRDARGQRRADSDPDELLADDREAQGDLPPELRFLADEEPAQQAPAASKKRVRRPTPSQAARAWLDRQAAAKRIRSVTITLPAEAIEIYDQVRRHGGAGGSNRPMDVGERPQLEGLPIATQVWTLVCSTPGYPRWRLGEANADARDFIGPLRDPLRDLERRGYLATERFEAEILAWPLPMTFYAPLPALCGAEVDEMARGRAEIQRELDREGRGDAEGRLLPGMSKHDDA